MTDTDPDNMGAPPTPDDTEDDIIYELPVDRGWAWVVLVASTLITTLYAGLFKSFGIFYVEILEVYDGNVSTTSLISSLQFAVYCVTTVPIMTSLLRHCSIRTCQIAGILVTVAGFGLSSLVHSLELLILTQSILSGLGMALVYPTAIVLVGKYFQGRIGLANGVLMSGYALGGVALPPLVRYILDEYRLEGALLLTAGIILNCLPPACLLRSMDFYKKTQATTNRRPKEGSFVVNEFKQSTQESTTIPPNICVKSDTINGISTAFNDSHPTYQSLALLSGYNQDATNASASAPNLSSPKFIPNRVSTKEKNNSESHIETLAVQCNTVYSGRINKYFSIGEFTNLSQEIVRNAPKDNDSSKSSSLSCWMKRLFNECKSWQMFSPKLWKNKQFLILIPIYCLSSVGPETSHLFTPSFAKDRGVSNSKIAILVSIQCMCDFVGRVFNGYIADLPWIRRQQIVMVTQMIAGIIMQMTPLFKTYWSLALFSTGYGLTAGIIFVLFPPILSTAIGRDMFPAGMAVMILIKGSFVSGIIPILGYLRDCTSEYHATFHFMGATSLASAILLILFDKAYVKKETTSTAI
ncbi:monocarboxylate transporter 5-like [Pecten maximus]|uniref:monocarboxylate transporter 5-like n=1 Tax=Pecten maximus TaxID=6579 RepID=UPI0014590D37|nr:monocarboxylate transporter 5-like [Pecten maximus]